MVGAFITYYRVDLPSFIRRHSIKSTQKSLCRNIGLLLNTNIVTQQLKWGPDFIIQYCCVHKFNVHPLVLNLIFYINKIFFYISFTNI